MVSRTLLTPNSPALRLFWPRCLGGWWRGLLSAWLLLAQMATASPMAMDAATEAPLGGGAASATKTSRAASSTPSAPSRPADTLAAELGPLPAPAQASAPGPLPSGWAQGGLMQIWVRSWRDSNGDGQGDLTGLIQSLDYLQSLGVSGLWLMSLSPEAEPDALDTRTAAASPAVAAIDGSAQDLDRLLSEAHQRGLGVRWRSTAQHTPATANAASAPPPPPFTQAARGDDAAVRALAEWLQNAGNALRPTRASAQDEQLGQRLWDQLGGDERRYRLAAASHLLLPAMPLIYYGEEIGMSRSPGLGPREAVRNPMSWSGDTTHAGFSSRQPFRGLAANAAQHNVAAQLADPNSLLAFYQGLLRLRQGLPSIARGRSAVPQVQGPVLSVQRELGVEHTVVVINYGPTPATLQLEQLPLDSQWAAAYPLRAAGFASDEQGRSVLTLAAQSVQVFQRLP